MNKRILSRLEQGEGTSLLGKLLLTRRQRQRLLKWVLFSLGYILLQALQDVLFSRVRIFGGCPDVVPGYLLLVCVLQGPASGGLFCLCASVFRSLSGAVLGPVSVVVLTFSGIFLSALGRSCLRRQFWTAYLCCALGIGFHQLCLFWLGIFLGNTTPGYLGAAVGGMLGCMALCAALYPLCNAIGEMGGGPWNE